MKLDRPPKYSLVLFPYAWQWEIVSQIKLKLKRKIIWFKSGRSKAHVTIAEFRDDEELAKYIALIRSYCKLVIPAEVTFNKLIFGNKTFFIDADNFSKNYINQIIRGLYNHIDKGGRKPLAHMSIARELSKEEMIIAENLFQNTAVDIKFLCDTIYLRRFNELTGQYSDIVEEFKLTGERKPDLFS